jgi:membrane peptidoglycan carboxypeptidase
VNQEARKPADRKARRRKRPPVARLLVRWALVLGVLFGTAGFSFFVWAYSNVEIPDPNEFVNGQATIITYADGSEIGRVGAQNRISVKLAEIPLHVRQAVMAAENRSFYTDSAISPTGILRAALNNLRGGSLQGGSTITQQYAKTAFLTPSRTFERKIRELIISIKLEQQLSKDEILENYLNTIYFGRGSYGVNTASQAYFGVDANQMTLGQSAVLASILRSPGNYDPGFREGNSERLEGRFRYVLNQMVEAEWLTKERADQLDMPKVKPRSDSGRYQGTKGYLMTAVQRELQNAGFTEAQLLAGGLLITTTFEKDAQQAAVEAVRTLRPKGAPDDLHIGLVAIKPGDGAVVAMYGGEDYLVRMISDATQSITQAGSTFKAFALVGALESGISLQSTWRGKSPQVFADNIGRPYPVSNFGNKSYGLVNLVTATANSINTVFVPLGIMVGPEKVVDVARRAGIPDSVKMDATPSVVLGTSSPRVLDVANAYATFAAQGVRAKPYFVTSVTSRNGGVLYQVRKELVEVFSKEVMADLTYALRAVVTSGSGSAARALGRPAAGKTGTSQSNASAWFSGYTPQLAASVSFFRDDATESLAGIGGLNQLTGGSFPARVWTEFMKKALDGQPILKFPKPANLGELLTPTESPTPIESATPEASPTPTFTIPTTAPTPTPTATKP